MTVNMKAVHVMAANFWPVETDSPKCWLRLLSFAADFPLTTMMRLLMNSMRAAKRAIMTFA